MQSMRKAAWVIVLTAIGLLASLLLPVARHARANPLTGIAAVSAGGDETCALTTGAGVKCWGNFHGLVGTGGQMLASTTPVDIVGLTGGVIATAGTCAITEAHGLKCWGVNMYGELGDGQACGTTVCTTPIDVTGLTANVVAVSVGGAHTCAITMSGGVKCWGDNEFGQLGNGTATGPTTCSPASPACSKTPVDVTGLGSGIRAVAAGSRHTCALTTTGGVKCWGDDRYSQLGNGTTGGPNVCKFGLACSTTPVDVSGLTSGVTAISAGTGHTCALTTGGGVKCWGWDAYGQLGDGSTENKSTPVDAAGLTNGLTAAVAGGYHTCALRTDGRVACWGGSYFGQLGLGTLTGPETCGTIPCSRTAVEVPGLTSVSAIAEGGDHGCALLSSGQLKCWGLNSEGQLGNGRSGPQSCDPYSCGTSPGDVVLSPRSAGDVTCDGQVNSLDAFFVLQLSAGLIPSLPCGKNADVNDDGRVDSIDAVLILQYSAGYPVKFRPPPV
jgi:hypothetical protein